MKPKNIHINFNPPGSFRDICGAASASFRNKPVFIPFEEWLNTKSDRSFCKICTARAYKKTKSIAQRLA